MLCYSSSMPAVLIQFCLLDKKAELLFKIENENALTSISASHSISFFAICINHPSLLTLGRELSPCYQDELVFFSHVSHASSLISSFLLSCLSQKGSNKETRNSKSKKNLRKDSKNQHTSIFSLNATTSLRRSPRLKIFM